MFVILNTEYFDESICNSEIIGYFTSEDNAESYLLQNGYTKHKAGALFDGDEDGYFVFEKVFESEYVSYVAFIEELKEII